MPTVAFDMGGVLLTDGSQTAWSSLERRLGIPADEAERLWYEEIQRPADCGLLSEKEIWEKIARISPGVSTAAIREIFLGEYAPIPVGVTQLRRAVEADWQVLLATNNVTSWVDYWRAKYDWMRLPESIVCSADIGIRKPDREFFARTRELVRAEPAYFADDKIENLDAAREYGFEPVMARPNLAWTLPGLR